MTQKNFFAPDYHIRKAKKPCINDMIKRTVKQSIANAREFYNGKQFLSYKQNVLTLKTPVISSPLKE